MASPVSRTSVPSSPRAERHRRLEPPRAATHVLRASIKSPMTPSGNVVSLASDTAGPLPASRSREITSCRRVSASGNRAVIVMARRGSMVQARLPQVRHWA